MKKIHEKTPMKKQLFVIGKPVQHSLSPDIHNFWIQKMAINAIYDICELREDQLAQFVKDKKHDPQFLGCNVTIPHKVNITKMLDYIEPEADFIGAVNTVYRNKNLLCGTNTDVYGIIEQIKENAFEIIKNAKNINVIIIGAGGAARAAIYAIDKIGCNKCKIMPRNYLKAMHDLQKISDKIKNQKDSYTKIEFFEWKHYQKHFNDCHLLINCSAAGMQGVDNLDIDLLSLPQNAVVFDIVYNPHKTKLLKDAEKIKRKTIDGIGMLIHQAAKSFEKFFGTKPKVSKHIYDKIIAKMQMKM